jgi:hypothetical protein
MARTYLIFGDIEGKHGESAPNRRHANDGPGLAIRTVRGRE